MLQVVIRESLEISSIQLMMKRKAMKDAALPQTAWDRQPLTWPHAALQAEGLSVEPIFIASTTSIPEECTDPVLSVKEPLSLIVCAQHSRIKVKCAWVCKLIN